MTDEAFLKAIIADPDDDSPRLIFADWLDEQGESEYSEFIRVQVALGEDPPCEGPARGEVNCGSIGSWMGPDWKPCRVCALRNRERELLEANDLVWLIRECPALVGTMPPRGWRRGFVHSIALSSEDWLAHGDALLAAQPVREVTLTTMPWLNQNTRGEMFFQAGQARSRPVQAGGAVVDADGMFRELWPTVKDWHLPPVPDLLALHRHVNAAYRRLVHQHTARRNA